MGDIVKLHPKHSVVEGLRAIADEMELLEDQEAFCTVITKGSVYHLGTVRDDVAVMRSVVEMQLAIQFLLDLYEDMP